MTSTPSSTFRPGTLLAAVVLAASGFCSAALAAQPAAVAKPDLARGQQLATQVCAACHAADGNSSIAENPKLAGQHPEYLLKQLKEFKAKPGETAARANAIMAGFVANLSEADMRDLSAYFAKQTPKPGTARASRDVVLAGERLYRSGAPEKGLPACAGCHGPSGAGIPAQYPRLAGQWAGYTAAQLTAFRDGARKNSLQMAQIAAKMNDREIKAVADYIAGLR
jgi:cytochrome c553